MKLQHLAFLLLAILALVAGCKKDDNPVTPGGGTGTTTYSGTLAGSMGGTPQSGRLALSFPNAKYFSPLGDTAIVTGTLYMSTGDTITLTGYYVRSTGDIYIAGGGYTITGNISSGHLSASYTGPGGASGVIEGGNSSGHTVYVYRGEYHDTTGGSNSGTFNMVNDQGALTVVTSEDGRYYGTVVSNAITIYVTGTSGTVLATGVVEGTHVHGTYNGGSSAGVWTGDLWE